MKAKPSVILMGSKPGSVVALRLMLARGWDVRYVVVSRKINHPWVQGPTLEEVAAEHGLKVVIQPELPREQNVDFVVSYMFRYRVKSDVISMASRAAVNFHAGPLPEFGGWAFYNIAILENSPEYGCTCHHLDDEFDTGDLLKVRRFPIKPQTHTAISLERAAQQEMVRLFVDFMDIAEADGAIPREPQPVSRMRYMSQQDFLPLKQIPADADAETIDRHARAFWYPPYDCAWTEVNGHRVEVVPELAKRQLAEFYQGTSLDDLTRIANEYCS